MNTKHTLKDRETISRLFQKGTKIRVDPVLSLSLNNKHETVLFSVSKKNIPRAVDRNKIKRQMHAIYFNNLELFLQEPTKAIALTYVSRSPTSFVEIKKSMTTLFSIIE